MCPSGDFLEDEADTNWDLAELIVTVGIFLFCHKEEEALIMKIITTEPKLN